MADGISMFCTIVLSSFNAGILKLFGHMGSSTRGLAARLVLARILQSTPQKSGEFVHRSSTVTSYGHVIVFDLTSPRQSKRFSQEGVYSGMMSIPSLDGEFGYLLSISRTPPVNGYLETSPPSDGESAQADRWA